MVDLAFGQVLCKRHERYAHTYFPLTGFISLTAAVRGHAPMEVGMIGNEGMLGASMVLGGSEVPQDALVQGDGVALVLTAADTRAMIGTAPAFVRALNRYLFVLTLQLAQSVACTRFHMVEARLARWLLMTHDRMQKDQFHLTHQFLADMLGVQRSAVTIASGVLKDAGVIGYSRGEIRILNRKQLEHVACECYTGAPGLT
ncbi:MAG: Crp/Fnr family transcriptional regulator [Gammaproteobacteria bacterium]|nr:Crp/Fnr family transcriptional regulator [Gammaproteobacteria bacterium]